MSEVKPFRVGFIGAGGIARTHMKYLNPIPGVEIVAAADVVDDNLTKAKNEYKVQRTYKDYMEMLKAEKEMDAVSVCTPNGLHAPNTIAALEAGKHVIVEKPMAMSAKEGQKMLDAANRAGKQLDRRISVSLQPAVAIHARLRDHRPARQRSCTSAARRCAVAAFPTGASSAARIFRAAGR